MSRLWLLEFVFHAKLDICVLIFGPVWTDALTYKRKHLHMILSVRLKDKKIQVVVLNNYPPEKSG